MNEAYLHQLQAKINHAVECGDRDVLAEIAEHDTVGLIIEVEYLQSRSRQLKHPLVSACMERDEHRDDVLSISDMDTCRRMFRRFFRWFFNEEMDMALSAKVQAALDKVAESDAAKDAAVVTLGERQAEQAAASQRTSEAASDLQIKTEARQADFAALLAVLAEEYQD